MIKTAQEYKAAVGDMEEYLTNLEEFIDLFLSIKHGFHDSKPNFYQLDFDIISVSADKISFSYRVGYFPTGERATIIPDGVFPQTTPHLNYEPIYEEMEFPTYLFDECWKRDWERVITNYLEALAPAELTRKSDLQEVEKNSTTEEQVKQYSFSDVEQEFLNSFMQSNGECGCGGSCVCEDSLKNNLSLLVQDFNEYKEDNSLLGLLTLEEDIEKVLADTQLDILDYIASYFDVKIDHVHDWVLTDKGLKVRYTDSCLKETIIPNEDLTD